MSLINYYFSLAKRTTGAISSNDDILVLLVHGQSNAGGRAMAERLPNTEYNYLDISEYIDSNSTKPGGATVYPSTPAGIKIYFKDFAQPVSLDNGIWQTYDPATNAMPGDGVSGRYGAEYSLAYRYRQTFGNDVYVIKYSVGGDAISQFNSIHLTNYLDYFVDRGIAQIKVDNPGRNIRIMGFVWWQGEADAGASSATYQNNWNTLIATLRTRMQTLDATFVSFPVFDCVIDFQRNAGEATVNGIKNTIAKSDTLVHSVGYVSRYPRGVDLIAAERDPQQTGGDAHSSYIGQLSAGELAYKILHGSYQVFIDVSGTVETGEQIEAVVRNIPTTGTYQWYRNSVAIAGATSDKYTLVIADESNPIKVGYTYQGTEYFSIEYSIPVSQAPQLVTPGGDIIMT